MKRNGVGEMLTIDGAAQALGTNYMRVWRYIHRHEIPTARLGRSILVRIADMQELSKEVQHGATRDS